MAKTKNKSEVRDSPDENNSLAISWTNGIGVMLLNTSDAGIMLTPCHGESLSESCDHEVGTFRLSAVFEENEGYRDYVTDDHFVFDVTRTAEGVLCVLKSGKWSKKHKHFIPDGNAQNLYLSNEFVSNLIR